MTEDSQSIPMDWVLRRLGDVLKLHNGYAFKRTQWSQAGLPIIRIQNLKSKSAPYNHFDGELPDRFRAKTGDLLFAWSGTPGTSFGAHIWEGPEAWINQHIFRVDFSDNDFDRDFLRLAINHNLHDYITEAQGGVGLAHITKAKLHESLLVVPPISTQRSIAHLIARYESKRVDAAGHLATSRRAVERFRRAILTAACSGRLTADWRESHSQLEPGESALQRRRRELRETLGRRYKDPELPESDKLPDIPDSWEWAALPEVGNLGRGRSTHRPRNDPKLYGGEYPFIQTGDVAQSDGRIIKHSQTYNEAGLAQSRIWPERTVCITIAANIADSALLTYPACFPDSVAGVVVNENIAIPDYVELFIRTARRDLSAFAPATAQANINLTILAKVAVALPPIEEQHVIVERVARIYSLADKVLTRINIAMTGFEGTSQAILAKAFRGSFKTLDESGDGH